MFDEKEFNRQTWYLQTDKINEMYNLAFESRTAVTRKEKKTSWMKSLKAKLGLSGLLKIAGVESSVETGLDNQVTSTEAWDEEWTIRHRILPLFKKYDDDNMLCDLNTALTEGKEPKEYFYFKGKIKLYPDKNEPEFVTVRGTVENFDFESTCSKKYFTEISSSLGRDLVKASEDIRESPLDVFSLGSLITFSSQPKKFMRIKLLFIGGKTRDIQSKFLEKASQL